MRRMGEVMREDESVEMQGTIRGEGKGELVEVMGADHRHRCRKSWEEDLVVQLVDLARRRPAVETPPSVALEVSPRLYPPTRVRRPPRRLDRR